MSIQKRLDDAQFLWKQKRYEGAFLSFLIAVAAASRRQFPRPIKDEQAFESFLKQGWFERISVEYRGNVHPVYHLFYKWFRCELVHEGSLPIDIEFMPDSESGTLSIRAGGAPDYVLQISYGWFHELIHTVVTAPINRELFTNRLQNLSDNPS